jgi:phenylpropionate dioxygenase-like ring-hydroxylating dioxygenase large terminal subunit
MFLKNCWYVAAWDHELIDGRMLARTILEEGVLLYKSESGKVVALRDRCCHRGVPLHLGRREGDCVRCMYHGLKFDPTGKCIQIPGQEVVPAKLGVKSYPVVEKDHLVWIWMGDPRRPTRTTSSTSPTCAIRSGRACPTTCTTRRTGC